MKNDGERESVAQQARPIRLEDAADLAAGGQRGGPVMVGGGEIAQRLEELRREQEHEQAARQRQRRPVRAGAEIPKQIEADVDGEERDAQALRRVPKRRTTGTQA